MEKWKTDPFGPLAGSGWLIVILTMFFLGGRCNQTQNVGREEFEKSQDVFRIALGSCNRQELDQSYWSAIADHLPDLWIWLGDNIYADTDNMSIMKTVYDRQKNDPYYSSFRSEFPVIGIWDDHDYGLNDGGREFRMKAESRQLLFEFLDVPVSHPAWAREGAFQEYVFNHLDHEMLVLLLDVRYFRDPLETDPRLGQRYLPNEDGDILGEQQWSWMENQLKNSEAKLILIGSGIQVIPTDHGYEKWANFPNSRKRFFELLSLYPDKYFVLLSGDRHISEFSKITRDQGQRNVWEITSSSLTHTWQGVGNEPNQFRVGPILNKNNFAILDISWEDDMPVLVVNFFQDDNSHLIEMNLQF